VGVAERFNFCCDFSKVIVTLPALPQALIFLSLHVSALSADSLFPAGVDNVFILTKAFDRHWWGPYRGRYDPTLRRRGSAAAAAAAGGYTSLSLQEALQDTTQALAPGSGGSLQHPAGTPGKHPQAVGAGAAAYAAGSCAGDDSEPVYRGDNGVEGALANALGEVGPTITAAAVCEMLAFGVGAATDIPALKQFCIVACVAVAIDYFLQLTWFAAAVALDGRRQEASRLDVAPCCVRRRPAAAEAALRAAEAEGAGRGPRRGRGSSSSAGSAVAFGAPAPLSVSSSSPAAATSPAAVLSPVAGVPGAFSPAAAAGTAVAGRTDDAGGCGSLSALVYRGQYVRRFCRRYYTPALLWTPVRLLVLVLWAGMLGLSGYAATQMQLGLPQQLALPQGSYLTQVRPLSVLCPSAVRFRHGTCGAEHRAAVWANREQAAWATVVLDQMLWGRWRACFVRSDSPLHVVVCLQPCHHSLL